MEGSGVGVVGKVMAADGTMAGSKAGAAMVCSDGDDISEVASDETMAGNETGVAVEDSGVNEAAVGATEEGTVAGMSEAMAADGAVADGGLVVSSADQAPASIGADLSSVFISCIMLLHVQMQLAVLWGLRNIGQPCLFSYVSLHVYDNGHLSAKP